MNSYNVNLVLFTSGNCGTETRSFFERWQKWKSYIHIQADGGARAKQGGVWGQSKTKVPSNPTVWLPARSARHCSRALLTPGLSQIPCWGLMQHGWWHKWENSSLSPPAPWGMGPNSATHVRWYVIVARRPTLPLMVARIPRCLGLLVVQLGSGSAISQADNPIASAA